MADAVLRRLRLVAAVADHLSGALEPAAVLARLAVVPVPVLGTAATVDAVDERTWELHSCGSTAVSPADRVVLSEVLATDDGTSERRVAARTGSARVVRSGAQVVVCAPVRSGIRTAAVLSVLLDPERAGVEDLAADLALTEEVAGRASLVLHGASRYAEQRQTAIALQTALLSTAPRPEHVELAVRYLPAVAHTEVGGDWYDWFIQPDGGLVVAVGDVLGHDIRAAAAMGQLRSMTRLLGYERADTPATVLGRVDGAMERLGVETLATAVLARVDHLNPRAEYGLRSMRWCNAGHPPPLLLGPGGDVLVLEAEPDVVLGVAAGAQRTDHGVPLLPGSTVLLYTDGLVERRGRSLTAGITALAAALEGLHDAGVEELCDVVLARCLPEAHEDDVALLALRTP